MTLQPSRRLLLQTVVTGGAALATAGASGAGTADIRSLQPGALRAEDLPRHFDVEPGFHNLEAGFWSMMPRIVAVAYAGYNAAVNSANAIWARNVLPGGEGWSTAHKAAQGAIARQMGCAPEEIAIARSGADALQMLITNYKPLKAGDAVIHCPSQGPESGVIPRSAADATQAAAGTYKSRGKRTSELSGEGGC